MFGGIGAKGGKKDLKQTRKNIRRKKVKEQLEKIERLEKEQSKKQEKVLKVQPTSQPVKKKTGFNLVPTRKIEKKEEVIDLKQHKESSSHLDVLTNDEINKNEKERAIKNTNSFKKKTGITPTILSNSSNFLEEKQDDDKKEEPKEAFLEQKVITQLENILKEERYQLKKLSFELEVLNKESNQVYQSREVEDKIDKINLLLDQLLKIKKELEIAFHDQKLDFIYKLDDDYLKKIVNEYKEYVSNQEVSDMIHNFKKEDLYTRVMATILEMEKKEEELVLQLDEKKKMFYLEEQEFESLQDEYIDISKVVSDLEKLVKEAEKKLQEVNRKVNEAVSVTTKMQIQTHHAIGLLEKSILLFSLFKMNPRPKANAITALQVLIATNLIKNMFTKKEERKEVKTYHFHDYQNLIENATKDIETTFSLIKYSIASLQEVKNTFLKDFGEHFSNLAIYQEFLSTIETVEKELL